MPLVEGSYGKAGLQGGRHAEHEEGQYIGGDYGEAGKESGLPEPLCDRAEESGRYVARDYGGAGSAPGRTPRLKSVSTPRATMVRTYRGSPAQGRNRYA